MESVRRNLRIFIFHKPRHRHHSDEKRHIAIRKVLILKDKGLRRLLLLGTFIDTDIKDLENDGANGQGSGNNSLENMIFYTKRQIALGLKMHPIALEAPFCYILKLMSIPYVEDSHQLIFEAIGGRFFTPPTWVLCNSMKLGNLIRLEIRILLDVSIFEEQGSDCALTFCWNLTYKVRDEDD
ncbi:hypothetical protein Csa_010618 [Cucumis sativus]|nr:hypothetical protein Csa_010618 [Cucumis sativus]